MIKKITLTPELRLGNGKLFKRGHITNLGGGSADVQLAIVGSTNFPVDKDGWNWEWNYNGNVDVGMSDTINIPMSSKKADFKTKPLDSFKLKVTMHEDGLVNIMLTIDGHKIKFTLTTEMLLANRANPSKLAKTIKFDTNPEVIPDNPNPVTPILPTPGKWYSKVLKKVKDFVKKYKWYFVGGYVIGLVVMGFFNLPVTIISFILGVFAGIII